MKKIAVTLFLVPVCVLSLLTLFYLVSKEEPLFLLKSIKIKGASQLSEQEIMEKVYPFLKESIFGADVSKMKEAISAHPFVREVRIKRIFPFSLLIDVEERTPSALWVDPAGDVFVVDEEGVPYRRLSRENTAGMFVISTSEKSDLKSIFRQVTGWTKEGVIGKESISEIRYSEGNVTLFGHDDGVEIILGKEDQRQRLKRAVAVLEDARNRGLFIRCIDARFEKGAIVKERKG